MPAKPLNLDFFLGGGEKRKRYTLFVLIGNVEPKIVQCLQNKFIPKTLSIISFFKKLNFRFCVTRWHCLPRLQLAQVQYCNGGKSHVIRANLTDSKI